MKKILLCGVLVCLAVLAGNAQPRALGLRTGYKAAELSYQVQEKANTMLEVDAGIGGQFWGTTEGAWFDATASYDWIFKAGDACNFYLGPALGVGYGYNSVYANQRSRIRVNVGAQLGVEFLLGDHFTMSLDYRPTFNPIGSNDNVKHDMVTYYGAALGLRYRF